MSYRKRPRPVKWGAGRPRTVIGDASIVDDNCLRVRRFARLNSKLLRKRHTRAEIEFEKYLSELNGGVLRGRFLTQWVLADRWILDFFFYENRLAVEIDGSIHSTKAQIARDRDKEKTCEEWDITLIRFTNYEVMRNQEAIRNKLREGWKRANQTIRTSRFRFDY